MYIIKTNQTWVSRNVMSIGIIFKSKMISNMVEKWKCVCECARERTGFEITRLFKSFGFKKEGEWT